MSFMNDFLVMNYLQSFANWFWSDYFWLPKGVSFKDLQDVPGFTYAKPLDLLYMPLYAIVFIIIRKLYEYFFAGKAASLLGIQTNRKNPQSNKVLEKFYLTSKAPDKDEIKQLSKETNWNERKVTNWFIRKRNYNRPDLIKKFSEASWRFMFYCFAFSFGISILYQSPWFWDNIECWNDYPRQSLWPSVHYYYMIEGGFYLSLAFSLMSDVKRKDFQQQVIHHLATLFLITFSYVANFVRVGSLVMAIHDISDIFLELAKCFVYAKWKVADDIFTIFAIVFIISRIFVFPYCVLHTTLVKSMWLYSPYPGYFFFNILLIILQCLHIFWAYIIISMAIRMARVGKLEKDARSDDYEESLSEEDVEDTDHISHLSNGHTKTE